MRSEDLRIGDWVNISININIGSPYGSHKCVGQIIKISHHHGYLPYYCLISRDYKQMGDQPNTTCQYKNLQHKVSVFSLSEILSKV